MLSPTRPLVWVVIVVLTLSDILNEIRYQRLRRLQQQMEITIGLLAEAVAVRARIQTTVPAQKLPEI